MRKQIIITVFFSLLLSAFLSTPSHADIKLKVVVVNPSPTESQTTPVHYDLPKGLTPEDITDIGAMELKYDFDKGNYYLYQVIRLKPMEKQVMEIRLRDIWIIPPKEISFLKNHTKAMVEKLDNTRHAKTGQGLAKKITDRLDAIQKKEADTTLTVSEHINLYYENTGILEQVKEDVGMLENLVLDVGGIVEERVQVPQTLAMPIKSYDKNSENTVSLTIKVSNPSATEKQTTNVKYILPEEITPRYVVDRGDLDMGYDFTKQSFYVYKENVSLNPSESKNYIIKIADIWRIPDVDIDTLKAHASNLMLLLKGSEYESQAKPIAEKVDQGLSQIKKLQAEKVPTNEHIADYRKDTILLADIKQSVAQLEKLASQSGASVGVTIKEAEVEHGGGVKATRPRGYEGIDYIVKSIFKGRAPTVATTWKIIYTILIFMGVLGALFFGLWFLQVKRGEKKEEKNG